MFIKSCVEDSSSLDYIRFLAIWITQLINTTLIALVFVRGAPTGGCQAAAPPPHKPPNLKNTYFVDIMISKVLRDLPFSRNQPLKSADDCYIRILKNKLIKLKNKKIGHCD
jgi:hypothetical protein